MTRTGALQMELSFLKMKNEANLSKHPIKRQGARSLTANRSMELVPDALRSTLRDGSSAAAALRLKLMVTWEVV